MRALIITILLLVGCSLGDNVPQPDAAITPDALPTTCAGWQLLTVPADDVGEVRLSGRVITPGVSYLCTDPTLPAPTTWSYWARRWDGRLGSYGKTTPGSTICEWRDAIGSRTPALGRCEP